jgi:hypothetical protein
MLIRIVQLTFKEEHTGEFLDNFERNKSEIRAFEGCLHVKLLQDNDTPNKFFTYSKWKSRDHLENYRKSQLFKEVWSKTKPLFSEKAKAWSLSVVDDLS